MSNELKPCPFCGSNEITIIKDTVDIGGFSYVECLECHATSSWIKGDNYDKWNTRQPAFNLKPIEELSRLSLTGVSTILLYSAERDFNIHDVCFVTDGTVLFVDNILGLYEVLETYTHYALLTPPQTNQSNNQLALSKPSLI